MSAMLDAVVAQILALQVRLLACRERLAADTDSEALHDLRIAVRRLRSLLRPLRGLPGVEQLEAAASALGALTTPLRDQEVLAAQLIASGYTEAGQRRMQGRGSAYASVARSQQLARVLAIADAFPLFLRAAGREGLGQGIGQTRRQALGQAVAQTAPRLAGPQPRPSPATFVDQACALWRRGLPAIPACRPETAASAEKAQADLGDWHDRLQWLLQARDHADLAPCQAVWQQQLQEAEQSADVTLAALAKAIARRQPGK